MSACSVCGAAFMCGMTDLGDQPCWCTELPALSSDAIEAGPAHCLCPACLQARLAATGPAASPDP